MVYVIDCEGFRSPDKQVLLDRIWEMTHKRLPWRSTCCQPRAVGHGRLHGSDRIQHGWKHVDPTHHRKHEPGERVRELPAGLLQAA